MLSERIEAIKLWVLRQDAARRAEFYEVMADSARQGLPQLEVLQRLAQHLPKADALRLVIDRVFARLRGAGKSASDARQRTIGTEIKGLLPDVEVAMIVAGEFSGQIENGWRQAAIYARRQRQMRSAILGALAKPLFYLLALIGLLVFFSVNLLPKFAQTRPRASWPPMAQTLGWVADHVFVIVGLVVALLVVLGVAFSVLGRRWTGAARDAADRRWPPFTVMASVSGAGFMMGLASFMASGVSFGDALQRLKNAATPYVRWQIGRIEAGMRRGLRPEEALLRTSLVPQRFAWMVAIYGMNAATEAARAYERIAEEMALRTQQNLQRALGAGLSNAMLVALGGMIMVIYFSLFGIATSGMNI